jgi:hypothetical protein
MRLTNRAPDAAHDPRSINARARVAAQVVTLLKHTSSNQILRPTFAKKFSPTQLPSLGESNEFEIQFLTDDLIPGEFEVAFELQTPAGDPISRMIDSLRVDENLAEGELLGFEQLRTHAGRGADTYVASETTQAFGDKPLLQVLRKGGQAARQQEHVYLRFDLSKGHVAKSALDRAVLLLTISPGGHQGTSVINVYGLKSEPSEPWSETGESAFNWNNSPCREGVAGQVYLGQLSIENSKDRLSTIPDGVRFFSTALDDFIRDSPDDLVTIVLVRENPGEQSTRFKSKEGKPSESPALAVRAAR